MGLRYSPLHVTELCGEMQGKFKVGRARLIRNHCCAGNVEIAYGKSSSRLVFARRLINKYAMECHFITYLVSRKRHFSRKLALLRNICSLPGPIRGLAPVIKCRRFLSFFQRYIVRDIPLT